MRDPPGLLAVMVLAACWAAFAALSAARAQAAGPASAGDNSLPLAQLPDWSGSWEAVSYKKHMLGHGRAPYRDLNPPFNAKLRPKFEEYKKIAYAGGNFPSRADRCVSYGVPGDMDHPLVTLQFLFTPGQVTLLTPTFWRVIHTDGRKHNEDFTSFQGDSIGHWDKDGTLVVDTTALDAGDEFILGIAQGTDSHVVERFHRQDAMTLIDDVTLEAPEVLTAPYHYQITYQHIAEPLIEVDCAQDNRDVNAQGDKTFDITPPPQ
jgi:hypothetical protein